MLELPDCLIAAVAVRLDMPLVTGNTEDFRAIQRTGINLTIENWRELQGDFGSQGLVVCRRTAAPVVPGQERLEWPLVPKLYRGEPDDHQLEYEIRREFPTRMPAAKRPYERCYLQPQHPSVPDR